MIKLMEIISIKMIYDDKNNNTERASRDIVRISLFSIDFRLFLQK